MNGVIYSDRAMISCDIRMMYGLSMYTIIMLETMFTVGIPSSTSAPGQYI